jgi:hypothetical protein
MTNIYNQWSGMPPLAQQHTLMQGFTTAFTVLRLLTPTAGGWRGRAYVLVNNRAEGNAPLTVQLVSYLS